MPDSIQLELEKDEQSEPERHDALVQLNASVLALEDVFYQFNKHLQDQGETFDHIYKDTLEALAHVESAKGDTAKAVKYQSKARKKKIAILACVLVFLLIVIAMMIGVLT